MGNVELKIINPNREEDIVVNRESTEIIPFNRKVEKEGSVDEEYLEMINYDQILEEDEEDYEFERKQYHHPILSAFCYSLMAAVTALEGFMLYYFFILH